MPDPTAAPARRPDGSVRILLTVAAVTLVAVAGYGGFRLAVRVDIGAEAGAGLLALAVITGFAALFSPCSFPLLVTMLAGPVGATRHTPRRPAAIATALSIGAGASLFLVLVGAIVGLVGEGIGESVGFSTMPGRVLRAGVAAVVVTAGLVQLGIVRVPLWRLARFAGPIDRRRGAVAARHQHGASALYGFGFLLAGFG